MPSRHRARARSKSRARSNRTRKARLAPHSYAGRPNAFNNFFSQIFIINLADRPDRFNKVTKQFRKAGVKYTRFDAVNGRCLKGKTCAERKRELEANYRIQIGRKVNPPVASLVLGTREIFKQQIIHGWPHILIFEDDVEFAPRLVQRFSAGIKDLPLSDWDILYIGCGNMCGQQGAGYKRSRENKYKSSLYKVTGSEEYNFWVSNRNDLRVPCDMDDCPRVDGSSVLTYPMNPGGGWAYGFSLQGAKKILKLIGDKISDHMDQLIIKWVHQGKLNAIAFDPPLVYHEAGAFRPGSDLPWEW